MPGHTLRRLLHDDVMLLCPLLYDEMNPLSCALAPTSDAGFYNRSGASNPTIIWSVAQMLSSIPPADDEVIVG
uniref:RES domain-containing protein n=1 Tax=Panagrellus redivivus TaxID=6233 RepID=A0A7E4ULT4_PANRE